MDDCRKCQTLAASPAEPGPPLEGLRVTLPRIDALLDEPLKYLLLSQRRLGRSDHHARRAPGRMPALREIWTMRAILIDPETKTFTEIQITDDIDGIQKVLRCGRFTTGGRPLRGSLSTGFDTLYVSDDSLEDREGPRFWFQVDADRDPPSSYPIAGPGLAYGIDSNGAACDVGISVAELQSRITFTQWKFRGFRQTLIGSFGLASRVSLSPSPEQETA